MVIKFKSIGLVLILLFLTSCDPGHFGKTFVYNESSYALKVKYKTHLNDTTINIGANSLVDIFHFGGLGSGRDFDCCSCEFLEITIQPTDTTKRLTKTIADKKNWSLTNSNTKRLSSKEISCEFIIKSTDIQ